MIQEIIGKLASESLLSLYPTIVKNINIPFELKLWTRFIPYTLISLLFIDFKFVKENLFSKNGFLLSFITVIHIYSSYKGFEGLESGVAYTIFYLYPLMILLMAGEKISPFMILPLVGVTLLVSEDTEVKKDADEHIENLEQKGNKSDENKVKTKKDTMFSVAMILLAGFTEALLYFVVRRLKTPNNWNHLFISYAFGAIALSGSVLSKLNTVSFNGLLSSSFILNIAIGLFGYLLRFYATTRLEPSMYAPLSYFGIVMSYVYGIAFNTDVITLKKVIGTLCVILPNLYIKI